MVTRYEVAAALAGLGVVVHEESDFSRVVEQALRATGIEPASEVQLSARDRIDFIVGRIGIELKTHASVASVIRQLDRYAKSDQLDSLVFVTTSWKLAAGIPSELSGKPITTVIMGAL